MFFWQPSTNIAFSGKFVCCSYLIVSLKINTTTTTRMVMRRSRIPDRSGVPFPWQHRQHRHAAIDRQHGIRKKMCLFLIFTKDILNYSKDHLIIIFMMMIIHSKWRSFIDQLFYNITHGANQLFEIWHSDSTVLNISCGCLQFWKAREKLNPYDSPKLVRMAPKKCWMQTLVHSIINKTQ